MRICANPSAGRSWLSSRLARPKRAANHVRIDRERAPELTLRCGPVEVEPVELERLLGTCFGQIRDQGEGVPDRQLRRLECFRGLGVGTEQRSPMRFGKPGPGQGV